LQASHLVLELENKLRAFHVRFVTLKGVAEIVPRKLSKGLLVQKVLRENDLVHDEGVDFILCMGHDISDEKMFTSVFSYIAEIGDEGERQAHSSCDWLRFHHGDMQVESHRHFEIRDPPCIVTLLPLEERRAMLPCG